MLYGDKIIEKCIEYQKSTKCENNRKFWSDTNEQKAIDEKTKIESTTNCKWYWSTLQSIFIRAIK
jgi:hypothetical protein